MSSLPFLTSRMHEDLTPHSHNGVPAEHSISGRRDPSSEESDVVAETIETERPNAIVENARREFSSAFGDLARGKRNWQLIAFALGAAVLVQALTTFRLASTAHPIPYVVQ